MTRRRSRDWISQHDRDPFVRKARAEGYRSRAAYKLLEIADREHLLRPGERVLDLGAAPGGWSQVAASRVGRRGRVVALDLLPMDALPGVRFVQGDFGDAATHEALRDAMEGEAADLILSDMAPNLEGIGVADTAMSLELAEGVIATAPRWLVSGGALLMKVFECPETRGLRRELMRRFSSVRVRKPAASKPRSSEIYLMAKGFGL